MGRNIFYIQINGYKYLEKKTTLPDSISVSSQNAKVNTTLALDCDQVH